MTFWTGVVIFALGILLSVLVHELGHLLTAKAFGMKATQYFAGFGPTLFSFRRGETEYGLKAIPAGGYVKIVGMTPLETVDPADDARAFWRFPLWQRTVVLVSGSAAHFVIAFVALVLLGMTIGLPTSRAVVGDVQPCVVQGYDTVDDNGVTSLRDCGPGDPASGAARAGLRSGDRIVAFGGTPVSSYEDLLAEVRGTSPGRSTVTIVRDGDRRSLPIDVLPAQRPTSATDDTLRTVGAIGVAPAAFERLGPLAAVVESARLGGRFVTATFSAIGKFPEKVPRLVDALRGQPRDPETPVSVVGASRAGGELFAAGEIGVYVLVFVTLNIFIGIFNLVPLLPLDGGHVAIVWFERVRSWLAARRGEPDPGRVDYNKLLPVTYVVIILFGGISLLAIAADILNPIDIGLR